METFASVEELYQARLTGTAPDTLMCRVEGLLWVRSRKGSDKYDCRFCDIDRKDKPYVRIDAPNFADQLKEVGVPRYIGTGALFLYLGIIEGTLRYDSTKQIYSVTDPANIQLDIDEYRFTISFHNGAVSASPSFWDTLWSPSAEVRALPEWQEFEGLLKKDS